ncbi:Rad4 transglutaminase-like domain-containing protein [Lasiosphaeris hirsuta]|uniref:Rad4 transglutaminase-like domain-containing protein n=1 Tax=Lasiosphaeris hirsuta TaxID=260670 RepID=A0AA40AGP3_9PEZI|nr:Rad4 transglutaminase-like domain-containing protein [Lasiosphaeris hirsuta]
MPPYVPRKRVRDKSPTPEEIHTPKDKKNKGKAKAKAVIAPRRKPTLFDDLDASSTPRSSTLNGSTARVIDDSQDDDSSLTSLSDAEFEDVPPPKRLKLDTHTAEEEEDEEDEDIEFEDVEVPQSAVPDVQVSGDLELTLTRDTRINMANALGKKGPSKQERKVRVSAHCIHVQLLMWHNAIRNAWLCDPEVQGTLLSHIPPRLWEEVDRWRRNSGLEVVVEEPPKQNKGARGKGKARGRQSRDWGEAAQRLEKGVVDMSHGDPLFRLMKAFTAWWKQRFSVTAPGLRKIGYMSLERLDRFTKAYKQDDHDPERFGERIRNLDEFRKCAQECTGSRDVGAQLFTALLRGLGLGARLVANLQPLGFGWNKLEEAEPEKELNKVTQTLEQKPAKAAQSKVAASRAAKPAARGRGRPSRAAKAKDLEEEASDSELVGDDSNNDSVIDIPLPPPRRGRVYDSDLEFPHYWTEVLSPVTSKYLAVDPIVKSVIATNRELVGSLEPRGAKADKAKQVMAYVVGYSADGTAKDVTVRYLKKQLFPGRAKGSRMPVEKTAVYDRNGKVKRYELYDWFKSVMKGYARGEKDHPFTEVDDEEDSTDLKPATAEKKEFKEGEETLQYYKQSREFVLERHLKREEALLPRAKPVKTFKNKGKGAQTQEEPVYSRKDVVQVKSAETWHKQGRAPLDGEQPLKRVPYRAATTNRRREIAEAELATGAKVLQGLYSFDQTAWIIPPPIRNGIIPKNEYGNIDLFVEHMCPEGAVHVPYRGTARVCKRLGIDYAEAVVDFEFGHRMAVPVIQGVVVAEEYHDQVMEELAKDEAEKGRKEDEKRRKAALAMWRKFMMGMRIVERIKQDYGHIREDEAVFRKGVRPGDSDADMDDAPEGAGGGGGVSDEDMGGGFLPEGYESEGEKGDNTTSAFFPVVDEHDDGMDDTLEVDHGEGGASKLPARGKSVMSTKPKRKTAPKAKASSSRRRRRRKVDSSGDEDEDVDECPDSGDADDE